MKHITGHISHAQITPDELVAVQIAFDIFPKSLKVWQGVIHRIPWLFLHGNYSEHERNEIVSLIKSDPELDAAIRQKYDELSSQRLGSRRYETERGRYDGQQSSQPARPPAEYGYGQTDSIQYTHNLVPSRPRQRYLAEAQPDQWPALPTASRARESQEATTAITPYGVIGDRRPAVVVESTVKEDTVQASAGTSDRALLKASGLYIKGVNGRDISRNWKIIPVAEGVDSVYVEVAVDESKISGDEPTEKIKRWDLDIANVFK